jgi:hypothetical protein
MTASVTDLAIAKAAAQPSTVPGFEATEQRRRLLGTRDPAGSPSAAAGLRVIYIGERKDAMLKKELIVKNPLRHLGDGDDAALAPGALGAVLARAGVGKTALVVQLALYALLQNRNVLHISLADPVSKVTLWYEEVFRKLADHHGIPESLSTWETVLTHRFIMTFQVEGFSVPKLEERLNDLVEQGIFFPQMVLIDGLPFGGSTLDQLSELKNLMKKMGLHAWFTVKTHRHQAETEGGLPAPLAAVSHLFDLLLVLMPQGQQIDVRVLEDGREREPARKLMLDPATLLLMDDRSTRTPRR